jgi:hypothetical protein
MGGPGSRGQNPPGGWVRDGWVGRQIPAQSALVSPGGWTGIRSQREWVGGSEKKGGVCCWFGGSKIKLGLRWRRSICVACAHGKSIA